ncbi:MAG: prolyl oligopeptidase family serine peptidase [Pseudomonadota bacterium]
MIAVALFVVRGEFGERKSMRTLLLLTVPFLGTALTACAVNPTDDASASAAASKVAENTAKSASEKIEVPLSYPSTRTVEQVDVYKSTAGEVEIADPYRWLEADVREDQSVADWVEAQNEVTFNYLNKLPGRQAIAARLTELLDYERYGLFNKEGGKYFFSKNDGLQDQSVYYVQDAIDGDARVLIDPNNWSEDGTVALAGAVPSPDASLVAYFVQDGGSDWRTIELLNVETGEKLSDRTEWVKFSGLSWAKDGSGYFYSRYPEPAEGEEFTALNKDQKVYFHALGTDQADDTVVIEDPARPDVGWGAGVSDDGDYLVFSSWTGTDGNGLRIKSLAEDADPVSIIENFDNNHSVIGNIGSRFLVSTDLGAPRLRIASFDLADPATDNWVDVIPEGEFPIVGVSFVGGHLIVETLEDAKSVVRVYTPEGEFVRNVDLPGIGSAGGFGGTADDPETFYAFTSFNAPSTIYQYNVETGESKLVREPDLKFDPADFVVEQVFFDSTGGVQVPMFIVHHRDVVPNGEQPTLLYGYGGFNISLTPTFSTTRLQWMEMGGVFALANIRGGGEYGRDWHDGGRKLNKQNVFDDFINAAEHLVEAGWANSDTIAIQGGSNGGLLVGAVANQRPELFAAALPAVGVMDMLRYNQFTAGRFWVDDYGDPADPEMWEALYAYSPLHNIPATDEFPATLVTTADTDDRVVPGHSFKYAAAIQAADLGATPRLIRIETRAGHGAGTPISKIIEATADQWAFIAHHTGLEVPETEE